jgi:hypothetical protein
MPEQNRTLVCAADVALPPAIVVDLSTMHGLPESERITQLVFPKVVILYSSPESDQLMEVYWKHYGYAKDSYGEIVQYVGLCSQRGSRFVYADGSRNTRCLGIGA